MAAILVDRDLCTRCGICSIVCPMGIVNPGEGDSLPAVLAADAGRCILCGHCEAHCPSQALLLDYLPDEKVSVPAGAGVLQAGDLGTYLKKRRSVRQFRKEPVPRETILQILGIARYAASGGNGQPVEWIVVHDPAKVHRVAELTIGWMKTLAGMGHPMGGYVPVLIRGWENGFDPVCRDAPHLLFAHIPAGNPVAPVDAIIALTHFDVAAPAHGIGACWAGFVAGAAQDYPPLREYLGLPQGRTFAYAMMFGYPRLATYGIPRRKPLQVTWQ